MDKKIEKHIVKAFFNKRIQERVMFELASSKKRLDALSRLSHNYNITLNEKYMIEIEDGSEEEVIIKLLKENGAKSTCYIISWDKDIDGKELPLDIAIKQSFNKRMPSIVSCISGELAYFQAEQEYRSPPRYILKR